MDIDYDYFDRPEKQRVEIRFRNPFPYEVCLDDDIWPNETGALNQAADWVFLVVDGKKFSIRNINTGYCPNGCSTRVPAGEEIVSFIPYTDFDLPEDLYEKPKKLIFVFPLTAYRCD
jgi:hypothetical protein